MTALSHPRRPDALRFCLLAALPLAIFSPLLSSYGLFEQGDANFPLNPFHLDSILPWDAMASAGADNVFVGVPRLVYHLGINATIALHNLQIAQWLWYSSMTWLGLAGAYLLARRLGAGIYAVPLAIFYAFNLWSYDRIAQGPIFLSYEALPLVVYLFLKYLSQPKLANALYFSCSVILVIPSLQVSYLAVIVCAGIAVRASLRQGRTILVPLALLALCVVLANGFYVFSMLADVVNNPGNGIALVNERFQLGIFQYYSGNVSIFNTLRLASFFYASIGRQPAYVQTAALLLPAFLVLMLVLRRPIRRTKLYDGALLALLGLWLVDGIVVLPALYIPFRQLVPGMRSFVEPDYFAPLFILGAFVMLCAGTRVARRAYGKSWTLWIWVMAVVGVIPFLPVNGPRSGLPQTPQPREYAEFSRAHVPGNTLIVPTEWGAQYLWSAYSLNGFPALNAPSDAMGPAMQEWVSPGTFQMETRLADAFEADEPATVGTVGRLLGVGTIEIAADQLGPNAEWPNAEVDDALGSFADFRRAGLIRLRNDYRNVAVHLVVGTTGAAPFETVGVYDAPATASGYGDFLWSAFAQYRQHAYLPTIVDAGAREAASLSSRTISAGGFDTLGSCTGASAPRPVPRGARLLRIGSPSDIMCASLELPLRDAKLVSIVIDADPIGVVAPLLVLIGPGHRPVFDAIDAVDGSPHEVPPWATRGQLLVRVPVGAMALLRGVTLSWSRALPNAPPHRTCTSAGVTWQRLNVMHYRVRASMDGTCTVVLRQSFASTWELRPSSGELHVLGHREVDDYANGWVVTSRGPVAFDLVERVLTPYLVGMAFTLACLFAAFGFAVRPWLVRR